MSKIQCSAVKLASRTPKAVKELQGTLIPDDHYMVKYQCKNGGPNSEYRGDLRFPTCGQHNNANSCLIASKGEKVNTNAVINSDDGVTNIDLQSGVETHQPKLWDGGEGVCCAAFQTGACVHTESQEEEKMEDIIDRPNSVFFYAVRGNGFRKEHEVPTFYYWKAGRVMVEDQNNLESLVQKHFQLHGSTKYIVIRVYGRVWCYKKDLTVKEMGSCVIKQSRF